MSLELPTHRLAIVEFIQTIQPPVTTAAGFRIEVIEGPIVPSRLESGVKDNRINDQ